MIRQHLLVQLALVLLASSILSLFFAPVLMPESYHWIAHTTSESGAQNIEGAWLARVGFVLYGIAVLLILGIKQKQWPVIGSLLHAVFGVCMVGNALFSSKPWDPSLPFNVMEDTLHSWMSGLVGTAFSVGVLVLYFYREKSEKLSRYFDLFAVLVSLVVSITMLGPTGFEGLIQRLMFLVSYAWYAREILTKQKMSG